MEAPYLALYRRYRPQVFAELVGQDAIVRALRAAVASGRVAHAYLFSGPRGTGKTSTARILAKALNCDALSDGEPCGACSSCMAIAEGTSLDVVELDAASNNGVEAVRELIGRVALGSPGRRRVFILDEVHMLSTAAANALLKTLEEPPAAVVFVLATTDPHKVPPTIRSRAQHFEFRLLGPEELGAQLRRVAEAAGLDVGDDVVAEAVRRGAGSVRDGLSALERLSLAASSEGAVADGMPGATALDELLDALGEADAPGALRASAAAAQAGLEPSRIVHELVDRLRQAFLVSFAPDLAQLYGERATGAGRWAKALGLPEVTAALERFGRAGIAMRDLPEPTVALELAVVETARAVGRRRGEPEPALGVSEDPRQPEGEASLRTASPSADLSRLQAQLAALEARLGALERRVGTKAAEPVPEPPSGERRRKGSPTLGALRREAGPAAPGPAAPGPADPGPADAGPADPSPADPAAGVEPAPGPGGAVAGVVGRGPLVVGLDQVRELWTTTILPALEPSARARLQATRPIEVEAADRRVVVGVPNEVHRRHCERLRPVVAGALAALLGPPIVVELRVDPALDGSPAAEAQSGPSHEAPLKVTDAPTDAHEDLAEMVSRHVQDAVGVDEYIRQRFPGIEEVPQ